MTAVAAPPRAETPELPHPASMPGFDLHGTVRIGLRDATPADAAVVAGQIGLAPGLVSGPPDITIAFVDRLDLPSPVTLVGVDDAGFAGDAFLVLRGKHKSRARVHLRMDTVGGACEITCERGLSAVPYLIAIINTTVIARGGLPLHASAFRYGDRGVLVTGWSKGGKTEVLLSAAAQGASYIGDEWIYLYGDRMRGIPEPTRLWDWHLEQLPACWAQLGRGERARLLGLRAVSRGLGRLAGWSGRRAGRLAHRLRGLVDTQRYAHLSPSRMFGPGIEGREATVDTVIFVVCHDAPETTIARAEAGDIAERMAFSLQEERAEFMACYRKFRFAFPHRRNEILERAGGLERERLRRVLAGKACYVVHHPYPPTISALFDVIRPVVQGRGGGTLRDGDL